MYSSLLCDLIILIWRTPYQKHSQVNSFISHSLRICDKIEPRNDVHFVFNVLYLKKRRIHFIYAMCLNRYETLIATPENVHVCQKW